MSKTITTPYDTADYLQTEEERALYLEACLEEAGDDPAFIAKALDNIARARDMSLLNKLTFYARD
jgi:probable addiction module antidote protein